MRLSRTHLALGLTVGSAALLAYALFGDSDEEKIMARLKELAHAVETRSDESIVFRQARVNRTFKEALEQTVSFRAPELSTTTGIPELSKLAAVAPQGFGEIALTVGETDIRIDDEANLARAVSLVTLTGSRGGELRREKRHVRFTLHESGGEWRVVEIDVEARSNEQPEARP
jgi:hypothetical protein